MLGRPTFRVIASALAILLSACTSEQRYDAGQGWRQNECNKIVDKDERDRCFNAANLSYDAYRRALDESKSR